MTDLPVQPAAPSPTSTQTQQPAPNPPKLSLPQAPVTQAPPQLQAPPQPVTVTGTVVSSDPKTQQLVIQTPQGEISVLSAAKLPPGTEVTVSLFMDKGAEFAAITVMRRQSAVSDEAAQIITPSRPAPPPPLKAGDTVTALRLPEPEEAPPAPASPPQKETATEKPAVPQQASSLPAPPATSQIPVQTAPPATPLTVEQAAHIIKNLKLADVIRLSPPPGVRPEVLKALLTARDPAPVLRALPPDQREKILAFLARLPEAADGPEPAVPAKTLLPSAKTVESTPTPPPETPAATKIPAQELPVKTVPQQPAAPAAPTAVTVVHASPNDIPEAQPATPQAMPPPVKITLPQAPMTQAPPMLKVASRPITLAGTVISSAPETQQLRIQTPQGEIAVLSPAKLAPGTDVAVTLVMDKGAEHAVITVTESPPQAPAPQKSVQPPPRKAVDAAATEHAPAPPVAQEPQETRRPPEKIPLSSAPPPDTTRHAAVLEEIKESVPLKILTPEQAVPVIRQMKPDAAPPPGVRPEVLKAVLVARDPAQVLRALPQEQREKILVFLSAPPQEAETPPPPAETTGPLPAAPPEAPPNAVQPQLPPARQEEPENSALPRMPSPRPAIPAGSRAETIDSNLLNIMRAQIGAKITQQVMQETQPPLPGRPAAAPPAVQAQTVSAPAPAPSSSPAAAPRGIGQLLALVEQLMPQEGSHPLAALRQVMTAGAPPQIPHGAPPLPQNAFRVEILQILAPAPAPAGRTPAPVSAPLPESAPPLPPPSVPQAQVLRAEVESVTPGGQPILRTEGGGHFVLQTQAPLPVGTRLVVEAVPLTPEQQLRHIAGTPAPKAGGTVPALNPFADRTWPALEQTLDTMEKSAPAAAEAVKNTLPSPQQLPPLLPGLPPPVQRLPAAALLFIAALRLGEIENWLGPGALQSLRAAGRPDLAERLAGDFGKLAEQAQTPLPGGWKLISMPLLHEGQVGQMQFFVRRQQDDGRRGRQEGDARPVTRFLLNLSLSRLGDMQLDGLVHKKQLDLILRTGDALPPGMRHEITQRFQAGLEQTHMQGALSFQAKRQNWVTVEAPQHRGTTA